ncbi:family 65 glycosyl hydrolase [Ruminococcaceae bacterium OttesenSCG-928-A16]|nr:family 65 glycosyl hydrolase [Ruminococcaceae bacterium OttesenSCG-928-A16]
MKLTRNELRPENLAVEESLFHTANGYLGVRGNFEEGYPEGVQTVRGCYINGFYDTVALNYPEKLYGFAETAQRMVNLPDIQTTRLWINGEEFSAFTGQLHHYQRQLDTDTGQVTRHMQWQSPSGQKAQVSVLRMASFARPQLFLTLYDVTLPKGGSLVFASEVNCDVANFVDPSDPRVASEQQQHIFLEDTALLPDGGVVTCRTGVSQLQVAACQRHAAMAPANITSQQTTTGFTTRVETTLPAGQTFRLVKYTLLSDERRVQNPTAHALQLAQNCLDTGADALLQEQAAYLQSFWETSRVQIQGDAEIAEGMEYNLYQLLQSAGQDSISNVAAKGLSGEGYEGHYFWDTEIYIFPFFLFTQPQIAKKLLNFRYSVLDDARAHARIMGHTKGALYPWRTIAGSECSAYFPSGSAQYHITGDVAHSYMQYYTVTQDIAYMAEKGAEVLLETARLWLSAGHYNRNGQFGLPDVTGPDEYTCLVNNNYYTNLSAQHNLRSAVQIYNLLKQQNLHGPVCQKIGFDETELAAFTQAANAMLLPFDETLGIYAQDDSFLEKPVWDFAATPQEHYPLLLHYHPLFLYRHQVCKQADTVLAHFLYEDGIPEDVLARGYNYYEQITTHDSSLSTCVFSIMAARLGLHQKAYQYFLNTVRTDLDNAHKNTKDGIHTANMGGAYLALVCGFAGLRVKPNGLHFRFSLPAQWQGYQFSIWVQNTLLHFCVTGKNLQITLKKGSPVTVYINGKPILVNQAVCIKEAVQ